mgnify:CR=1 FL=1
MRGQWGPDLRRAVLVGYYGLQNTGDDALLAVAAWGSRRYLKCDEIFATAGVVPGTYGVPVRPLYARISSFPLPNHLLYLGNFVREYLFLRRPANIVFGGGSNLHSRAYLESRLALIKRTPGLHAAVGVSVGPFRDAWSQRTCSRLLNHLSFVGVRDRASYERVRQIAPDARVELTFDLSALLPVVANSDIKGTHRLDKSLGIAMCNCERVSSADNELSRISAVAEAVRKAAIKNGIEEVVLLDFNGHRYYGDAKVSNMLAKLLRRAVPVRHIRYTADSASVIEMVARLRAVVAMRFHAAIFAFCTATPFVMLAYHEKCHELANLIGLPSELQHDGWNLQVDALTRSIQMILDDEAPAPSLPVDKAVEMTRRNWTWINGA